MDNILLELSDDFFLPEVRNDCYISAERKKIWAVELDLLNKFFSVCNEYDIKAFAISGTLLGAVRHQGFIPWDDDVDICMTRENYNKLEKIADTAFKTPYFFQTARNDKRFFSSTPRLRNSNTTGIVAWNYSSKYNNGIFLDSFRFPLHHLPECVPPFAGNLCLLPPSFSNSPRQIGRAHV